MTPQTQPRPQPRPSPRRRAGALSPRGASRTRMPSSIDAVRRPRAAAMPAVDATIATHLPHLLLAIAFVAAIAVLSFPAARASTIVLGWMPLWLVGMPLVGAAALRLRARGNR